LLSAGTAQAHVCAGTDIPDVSWGINHDHHTAEVDRHPHVARLRPCARRNLVAQVGCTGMGWGADEVPPQSVCAYAAVESSRGCGGYILGVAVPRGMGFFGNGEVAVYSASGAFDSTRAKGPTDG
jgi:hypothetical protein